MSNDDSKQLSVAELLARNAAQGSTPSSGGGGRRRRSGRGLSVTDLTGENATVRSGPSSHAAPSEPEPPAPDPGYAPEPAPPASYQPAPYPPPGPAEPAFSPMSGPISRVDPGDPLGLTAPRPAADPFGPFRAEARDLATPSNDRGTFRLGAPSSGAVDPEIAQMFGSGAIPAVGGGRRRRPEPEPEATPSFPEPPQPPPATGGRAARRRAAEAAEEAAAPPAPAAPPSPAVPASWAPQPPAYGPTGFEAPYAPAAEAPPQPFGTPGPGFAGLPDFAPRPDANATQALNRPPAANSPRPDANATQALNRPPANPPRPDATQALDRAPAGDQARPELDQRPSLDRRRPAPGTEKSKLPSWSARRHRPEPAAPESGGFPTAAWSPVSQEQPLIAGQSVAGDLLRQRAEHGPDADAHTEVYSLGGADPDTDDYAESDYAERDYADNDYSEYADGEYDEDDYYDDEDDDPSPRRGKRAATKAVASKMASRAKSRAREARSRASRVTSRAATASSGRAESRGARAARGTGEDAHRRQWMILGAQSAGAAIAGMLLFKGFETMWETLPWVALALAMVVILGLVALVRVLRRTDDIFSTVIAVVVGVFVTLGPLAFLLSTS
ncbi:hypothetical protein [Nocardia sp. AG03]|uniref:hypothetical protein n=1 Tax=Nocardia sp. AG03 TaxID=3025312 RepID=UPI0024188178|nr:hypothetical protein [Nocardia sp. AG03]